MATTINANNTDGVVITPDTSGELELQANGVTKAKVTANGLQDANGNSLRGGSFRNLIINGDMRIAQRGTSFPNTDNGTRTLDMFAVTKIGAQVATVNQVNDSPTAVQAGVYNTTCLEVDVTTADTSVAANDMYAIIQQIEGNNIVGSGFGQSGTRYVTLSFWVKTNKTGIYCVGLTNGNWGALERTYVAEYTVSSADTWEKKTITVPVDTTGTWRYDNLGSLSVRFSLYAGSDFHITKDTWIAGNNNYNPSTSNQVNLFDSTSNYFRITLVQLEVGEGASDFEFLPYDVQLARCQRYCLVYGGTGLYEPFGIGVETSGTNASIQLGLPVTMRGSISFTASNVGNIRVSDGSAFAAVTALNLDQRGLHQIMFNASVSSGLAATRACRLIANNSLAPRIIISSEI